MTELEVLTKLINILQNDAIEDTKLNNPNGLKQMFKWSQKIILMNNLNDIYWYLNINFVQKVNKNWEDWQNCKYSFENLPGLIRTWLGREPKRLSIDDTKIGELLTREAVYARFNKYHQVWAWLIDDNKNKIIFYNSDLNLNKWTDKDNIKVQVAEVDQSHNLTTNYKGVDRKLLSDKILSGSIVYVFDSIEPYLYEFKGQFIYDSGPFFEETELENGQIFFKKIINLRRATNVHFDINSKNMSERIFVEGELTQQIIDTHSRKNIRNAYFSSVDDPYVCRLCGKKYNKYQSSEGIIEIHHLYPIRNGTRETKLEDVVGLCPNCHRWVHSIKSDHVLTFKELKNKYNRTH